MTLEELAAKWEASAQHQRRTAKQQRTACREGNSAKVRLLSLAVQAEEHARELRAVSAASSALELIGLSPRPLNGKGPTAVILDEIAAIEPPQPTVDNREALDVDLDGCEPHQYPYGGTPEMQANRPADEEAKAKEGGSD